MASWDNWTRRAVILPVPYHEQVSVAGGVAVIVPPQPDEDDLVQRIDGLVLAGGGDVDPWWYGAPRHPATHCADPQRDEWEMRLIRAALAVDLPTLGICRGMQLVNVARGGTLIQHLPDQTQTEAHRPVRSGFGWHPVTVAADSHLYAAIGRTASIATHHHQAVDRLGDGVQATAWADDGVIEGIEVRDRTFVCGVQGHAEESDMNVLFVHLVDAASERTRAQRELNRVPTHRRTSRS